MARKLKDLTIHYNEPTNMGGIRITNKIVSRETIDEGELDECVGLTEGDVVARGESASGGGMTNPMTTANDIIVGGSEGAPTRLAAGTNGQFLKSTSEGIAWSNLPVANGIGYLTTAPVANNPDSDLKFVVLDSEPATYYDGYYYIITESVA